MAKRASKRKKRLVLRPEWCKGCLICVEFCPKQVLALDQDQKIIAPNEEACIACGLCELRCPDLAIELMDVADEEGQAP